MQSEFVQAAHIKPGDPQNLANIEKWIHSGGQLNGVDGEVLITQAVHYGEYAAAQSLLKAAPELVEYISDRALLFAREDIKALAIRYRAEWQLECARKATAEFDTLKLTH